MYGQENKMVDLSSADINAISLSYSRDKGIDIEVLRLDKLHPVVSGNKWFKLKNYLSEAAAEHYDSITTFGGAYSNHIVATAYAALQYGMKATGVIRGEESKTLSPSLKEAAAYGMQLRFISREDYKHAVRSSAVMNVIKPQDRTLVIPEGGAGRAGIKGSEAILDLVDRQRYTHIICAIGTGTMFLGLLSASLPGQQVIGIPVLKGFELATEAITGQLDEAQKKRCMFFHQFHFGGYAKKNQDLITFMNQWYHEHRIPTDFVYTAKLFYALSRLVEENYFPAGSRVLAIHSGGLQGNRSLSAGSLIF